VTGPSAHGQQPTDRWLADRHHDLHDRLGRFLDPDVGLREAMLHAEHANLLSALDSMMDTEAGLTAILPPPAAAAPQPAPGTQQRESGEPGMAAAIADADPAARMALRRNPLILAVILSDLLVRALVIARSRDLDLASDLASALASAHARASDRDFDRVSASDLNRALELASDLDRVGELARVLAHASAHASVVASASDLDLASDLGLDRILGLDLGLDFFRASAFARDLAQGRDLDLAGDLDRARDLARHMAFVLGRALGIQQVEGLAAALLEGALDDFTRADLSQADLTGLNLVGVRWSAAGTRWPPGTDVDALRARSRKVAPGVGIYEIISPGGGRKAHVPV
jgi:hypothetical protein